MLWKALEQPYNFVFIHGNSQTAHNGYTFFISRTVIPRTLCSKSKIVDLGRFWNKKIKILKISLTVLEIEAKVLQFSHFSTDFQNFKCYGKLLNSPTTLYLYMETLRLLITDINFVSQERRFLGRCARSQKLQILVGFGIKNLKF